ncbi:MAG: hypothetical protein AAF378_22835 [Cyanobacteria bacterium P01_A01_bin.84]
MSNESSVNVNSDRAGDIHIEGNNISLSGASSVDSITGNQDSGEISIRTEKLEIT